MRKRGLIASAVLSLFFTAAHAYVPGLTPSGAQRRWSSGNISVRFTGPSNVDGQEVQTPVLNAMASWNNTAGTIISFTMDSAVGRTEPSIGNGVNEFGWADSSNNPYLLPNVPCTTAYTYIDVTGVMLEADTTCNALNYQWPDYLFGNYSQDKQADAETMALTALGYTLGLDASLSFGDPMYPSYGSGYVQTYLSTDSLSFAQQYYNDGTANNGSLSGTVRRENGAVVPFAYVTARSTTNGNNVYGAVADADGAYTINQLASGSYFVWARPLTTDPTILSSVAYRFNPVENLDFTPQYVSGSFTVSPGSMVTGIDFSITRSGTTPDAYEPNDAAATGSPLALGTSKLASMNVSGDQDWFYYTSAPNTCYVFRTLRLGASTIPTNAPDTFWSTTQLALYSGATLLGQNISRDDRALDPSSWITFCEGSAGRRLDLQILQRNSQQAGPGYFYTVLVNQVTGGTAVTPSIGTLYPNSGWVTRNRYVWIDGSGFMPSARVDVQRPGGTWVAASDVIATRCDGNFTCTALKAVFPTSALPGFANVRVTNPNGVTATRNNSFEYLAFPYGPVEDLTVYAFGSREGAGRGVCVGDYDDDGLDDILKTGWYGTPYQLYHNDHDTRPYQFSQVAAQSGLHVYDNVGTNGCSWIDVDDDGDLDAYVSIYGSQIDGFGTVNELYKNQLAQTGGANFVLGTPDLIKGDPLRYKADAAWADFDKDGKLDVVLAYDTYATPPYYQALRLLHQNSDGSFSNQTPSVFNSYFANVETVRTADFNNDGCNDVVVFAVAGTANKLYRGNCYGGFTDFTAQSHISDLVLGDYPSCSGVGIADFNNDGNIDIFCGTWNSSTFPGTENPPRLWLNDGLAQFTDVGPTSGLYNFHRKMQVVIPFDEDNDGLVDVYLGASNNAVLNDSRDMLLHNNGGNPPTFSDITDLADMYPTTWDGTGYCDSTVDEYYCDRDAWAGGAGDWDNSGAQDVFITGWDQFGLDRTGDFLWYNWRQLLRDNHNAPSNDWIKVALKGGNTPQSRVLSNRFGIGAKVTVIPRFNLPDNAVPTEAQCLQNPLPAGVVGYTREVLAGNKSQSSTVLHYGLGNTLPFGQTWVDCIRVKWPSGLESAYVGLNANNKVVLAEDAGRIKVLSVFPNSTESTQSIAVTVGGLHFERDVIVLPQVFFGTAPAASVTFVSEHELTAFSPLGQPARTVDITVTNPDGESDTLLAAFTFTGVSSSLRFKDPVPELVTTTGTILTDPNTVAAHGADRIGAIADGVTQLVIEVEVSGPGSVRFAIDDDNNLGNGQPSTLSIGSLTALGGASPATTKTVTATQLSTGRYLAHAVYLVPQDFIRTAADNVLAFRAVYVNATFVDGGGLETALPSRFLALFRVPLLFVHGMWGTVNTFGWAIMNDPRWISLVGNYEDTNDRAFVDNKDTPKRLIKELRDKIHTLGIAGTRFTVAAHSMGGVLFKIFIGGGGAPYTRADNFFAGDVYELIAIDSPFFGSYLAPLMRRVASLPGIGEKLAATLRSKRMAIDNGCMLSLDPASPDTRNIQATTGTFHVIQGWGGREMRTAGVQFLDSKELGELAGVLQAANYTFDNYLIECGSSGDDMIVCTDSQAGGLASQYVSPFHYQDLQHRAIHFDSVCKEPGPNETLEAALNTPTTTTSFWAGSLPATPNTLSTIAAEPARGATSDDDSAVASSPLQPDTSGNDGYSLSLQKQGDSIVLNFTGGASRLLKGIGPAFAASVCLAVSGGSFTDSRELTSPSGYYYVVGGDALCAPAGAFAITGVNPTSGSYMGGYTVTLLGNGFDATTKVKVGTMYAANVVVVNSTTLTFFVMPGMPGATIITAIKGSQTATTTFTYIDPGPIAGSVQITSPSEGATVAAGSALTVTAIGVGGYAIAKGTVFSETSHADTDLDPGPGFTTTVNVPITAIGQQSLTLWARDAAQNLKDATVHINVVVPSGVSLHHLQSSAVRLLYETPTAALRVDGVYTDGVTRNVTHASGTTYLIDPPDASEPGYPYNGTAVATVDTNGVVTAKTVGSTICHVTYLAKQVDVVITVVEVRPMLSIQNPGIISIPYQGLGVTYSAVRGSLSMLRSSGGSFATATDASWVRCNLTTFSIADSTTPPVGDGRFYLMRTSRERSYEESPFWSNRSQVGERTTEIAAMVACP